MHDLAPKQSMILDAILRHQINDGYTPTQKQLAAETGWDVFAIRRMLDGLERAGMVRVTRQGILVVDET